MRGAGDIVHDAVSINDPEMTEEDRAAEQERLRQSNLNNLGESLAKSRSAAIAHRQKSGIEKEWVEDDEYYQGIDDANRRFNSTWTQKPVGQVSVSNENDATSSTIFPNITGPYVDMAAARVGDMLLPTSGDRGWEFGPTPIPDMVAASNGNIPMHVRRSIEAAGQGDQQAIAGAMQQVVDEAAAIIEEARVKAEKAQERIDDWHKETGYNAEMRQIIDDAAKLGTGVLKGPFQEDRKTIAYIGGQLQASIKQVPYSKRVTAWNCYPDPGCGENIQDGSYHWERGEITRKEVERLLEQTDLHYIPDQIREVLREGPTQAISIFDRSGDDIAGTAKREDGGLYEIWYYFGILRKEDLEAAGVTDITDDMVSRYAAVEIINNRVIKAVPMTDSNMEFPYDYMVWKKRDGIPWGKGMSRQMRPAQDIVKGAIRNMMDNAGIAAAPMWMYLSGVIEPLNGISEIKPRKGWRVRKDVDPALAERAFRFVEMPMHQVELERIVEMGLKLAEYITGFPMLLQGQMGGAPDTLGGMQLLNNNASTTLRRIARLWDDRITSPHIRRYYRYLLEFGDDSEKGDFSIDARGSSALVEKDIQQHAMMNLLSLGRDPVYGLDPKKLASEFLASWKFDPSKFEYDDEQWKKIVENLASAGQGEKVQIAQMNNDTKLKLANDERIFESAMKEIDVYLANMDRQSSETMNADKLRTNYTALLTKLRAQIATGIQGVTPPTEPAGRAPNGMAYQA